MPKEDCFDRVLKFINLENDFGLMPVADIEFSPFAFPIEALGADSKPSSPTRKKPWNGQENDGEASSSRSARVKSFMVLILSQNQS